MLVKKHRHVVKENMVPFLCFSGRAFSPRVEIQKQLLSNFVTGILQEVRKKATSTRFVDFGKELPIWYFGGSFPHSLFFSAADEKKQDTLVKSLTVRKENKQKLKLSRKFFPKHQNNIKEQKTNLQEKNLRQC